MVKHGCRDTSPWRSFGFASFPFGFGRRLAGLLGLVLLGLLGLFLSAVFRGFVQSVGCDGLPQGGRFA